MSDFLRGRTPSGQRVVFAATNLVIVDRFVDDKPVFGQSVVHLPGLPPLILEGAPAEIVGLVEAEAPRAVIEIPPTETNEV